MKLGGGIELEGFDNLEPAHLIVVKKMVGSSAKKLSENIKPFDNLTITLKDEKYSLQGKVTIEGTDYEAEANDKNLFFAINKLFEKLTAEIQK